MMKYFRNKEIKHLTILLAFVSVVLLSIAFLYDTFTGVLVLLTSILFITVFWLFTMRRYRDLIKLSDYLRRISSGEYSLDIRDNREGELSILKSEIYKVTLMLIEYNELLKQDKLSLSNQMAEISHQLKTPLTSMRVMVDLLNSDELPADKRREFTSVIHRQLERMEWLVSALLKMSRLDAGVVVMKPVRHSVNRLIDHALSPFLITMELKDISYTVSTEEYFIHCDFDWTVEAVINIIKNAIEHTPIGGRISISAKDNPLYLELQISDNGVGIAKDDIPNIFTRFYQGKNSSRDSVGIGLAMSYQIMKAQQGDIQVKSEPGEGTTFILRFYKSVV